MIRLGVVCTDRGQHSQARLGELDMTDDGHFLAGNVLMRGNVGGHIDGEAPTVVWEQHAGGVRVRLRCLRCGRDVVWRDQRARQVVETLGDDTGDRLLDLSHIP